jgi:hypothetical protein
MLQRTVSTSLDLAITPFACAHMDTASAPVDNRIFKVHWANDMASTLKKSLLWVGVIAGLNAAEICGARAACDDPRYVALRQSLVAQLNSIGARIEAGNCASDGTELVEQVPSRTAGLRASRAFPLRAKLSHEGTPRNVGRWQKKTALEAAPSRDGEIAMAVPDTAPSARPPDSASSTPGDYAFRA